MANNSEHRSELRLRTRTTLDNLEVKDLCGQSLIGLQRICDRCAIPADLCLVLKETLSGLSCANTQARRLRYKGAATAVSSRAAEWVGPSVHTLVKHVLERVGQEEHQSNQEELAGLLKALAVAAVAYNAGQSSQQKDDSWFGKLLTEPLLKAAASGPSKQRVANGCTMVHAVLTAVLEWANYQPVILASVDCLKIMLHYLNTGLLVPRVPEVYLPLKQCIEILGANLQPRSAKAILDQCLQGITQKEDWQIRRQAVETFITLAAAVQVHKPSEGGQWHLEHTPCIEVLVRAKGAILNALTDAKYDKITHVRQAVGKALVEMDCIPSPRANPKLATAFSAEAEDSDLETLLASKRAKPNSRPLSGESSGLGKAGSGRDALEEAGDQDDGAPSPRSDMGTAFEPEHDSGDSPRGPASPSDEAQLQRDSLQSKQGSRRRWAGSPSASLNRLSAGVKGNSRTPLSHVSDSTRLGRTTPPAGVTAKQRKENLTPAPPRQSFVKPKKQVFADFGVQVFAPLPRAISPEREVPKSATPDEEDNSPVGPLKLQLPDLMNSSEKERTTVLVEGGEEEQQASADLSRDASQHAGSDSAPVSDSKESVRPAEGSAESGGPSGQPERGGSPKADDKGKPVQDHAEHAEAGPDVHVDKAAGTISIAHLPPGSSIRLVGLQHSLYEHPVRVEISAPSERGVDHFSYSLANDRASHQALHAAQRQTDTALSQSSPAGDGPDPPAQSEPLKSEGAVDQSSQESASAGTASKAPLHGQQEAAAMQDQGAQAAHQTAAHQPQHAQQGDSNFTSLPESHPHSSHTAQHPHKQVNSPGPWESPQSGLAMWSSSGPPTMTHPPGSGTKQDPQQQLLQQLAAQTGFQLLPPPSQSPVMSMAQSPAYQFPPLAPGVGQPTPSPQYLQQQQLQSPVPADVGFSQGLLQHLGQDLQSSARQMASMQQQLQQQQSRLPAWAQQAWMPQQQQMSSAFSPHANMQTASSGPLGPGLPTNGLIGQFPEGPHGQFGGGMHAHGHSQVAGHAPDLGASQGMSSLQASWQQQQQQPGSLDSSSPWLNPHLQQQGSGGYWHGECDPYQQEPEAYLQSQSQMVQQQQQQHSSTADRRRPQRQHDAWHQDSKGASNGVEPDEHSVVSAQGSAQGGVGMPSVLSGGSSGLSSPLRESGHLESLLEVNSRVEAAMDRARAQLQGGGSFDRLAADASLGRVSDSGQADPPLQGGQAAQGGQGQRARPRGLPSTVESTITRITRSALPSSVTPGPGSATAVDRSAASSSATAAHAQAEEEPAVEVLPPGTTLSSPSRSLRGQGKPPLSPVRQSLQDLVSSRDSSPGKAALVPFSLDPVTGVPIQDVNVHCNPLFTEPTAGQHAMHGSPSSKQLQDRSGIDSAEQQQQQRQKEPLSDASADGAKDARHGTVPSSPPSQLQKSLRALMQQHTEELEDL